MSKKEYLPGIGFVEVDDTSGIAKRTNVKGTSETGIASEISRKIGLNSEIVKNDKIIKALNDPSTYLTEKNKALKDLEIELDTMYATEVYRLIKGGVSNNKAEELATKSVEARREIRIKEIEIDYPTSVEKLVLHKLKKKNEVK